jgi:hypothetical protein
VGEESHLEEMRSAIRGDFARLAARRGDQELMRISDEDAPEVGAEPTPPDESDVAERRSWLARLIAP